MIRTVTGYQDGRPVYRDEGPARARPAGWGGAALGSFTAPTVVPRKPAGTATPEARAAKRRSV